MTHHDKKPRGADRRGFYRFEWINERRSGQERRFLSSEGLRAVAATPVSEARDEPPAIVTEPIRD